MASSDSPETLPSPPTAQAARQALLKRVRRVLDEAGDETNGEAGIVRVEEPVAAADPLVWLAAEPPGFRWYWAEREGEAAVAATGIAAQYDTAEAALEVLRGAPVGARAYGGGRFDPAASVGAVWERLGAGRLVLPRLELRAEGDATTLACTLALPQDARQPAAVLRTLRADRAAPAGPEALPACAQRTDEPGHTGWTAAVAAAAEAFAASMLDKVVLARETTIRFDDALDPVALLRRLRAATPGCFHFLMQPSAGAPAFVGASPERLFRQVGRRVESEAVAGTRPRGTSAGTDAALREELLGSEKDRREHGYVRQFVQDALRGLCTETGAEAEPSAMTLAQGRHLYARLRGTLRPGVTAADVLAALHPTPAVGGVPTDAALRMIRTQEAFDRGWYAGPLGWLSADAAEFAVAIRSGLVEENRLRLYAGAGLVEGSAADREWAEVEQKLDAFAEVTGFRKVGG